MTRSAAVIEHYRQAQTRRSRGIGVGFFGAVGPHN
jgi:hypothetical protein